MLRRLVVLFAVLSTVTIGVRALGLASAFHRYDESSKPALLRTPAGIPNSALPATAATKLAFPWAHSYDDPVNNARAPVRSVGYRHAPKPAAGLVDDVPSSVPLINGSPPKNASLAGGTHPSGVRFTPDGFPDFSPHAIQTVRSPNLLTGDVATDMASLGLDRTPGYTWHHVEDGFTMQLVPRNLHAAVGHTGGAAVSQHIMNNLFRVMSGM